jgi:hypothetical protein
VIGAIIIDYQRKYYQFKDNILLKLIMKNRSSLYSIDLMLIDIHREIESDPETIKIIEYIISLYEPPKQSWWFTKKKTYILS